MTAPPRILVVQNDPDKGLGRIADALAELDASLDVVLADDPLPAIGGYDGLVVLPGLADPVDDDPAVHRARAAITDAVAVGMPVLGLCLGGQLAVQVLGGEIYRSAPEVGFHEVRATAAADDDPLLATAPDRFAVFHAHGYAFRPPAGATVLLENDVCVQACRVAETWAFQCHPETTAAWVIALAGAIRGDRTAVRERTAGFFRSGGLDPDRLERDGAAADTTATLLAEGIARGFLGRCASWTNR